MYIYIYINYACQIFTIMPHIFPSWLPSTSRLETQHGRAMELARGGCRSEDIFSLVLRNEEMILL